jgi:putative Mg2+ transporter-C (MgtC) family protein
LERELRNHDAGMRTIALVSLGSALFTIVSAYGFLDLLGIPHVTLDPTRVTSYIVAGIGFLGAGTIFLSRTTERVKGLTTAATIWVIAAIGLACGAGLLLEAVATTVMILIVLVVLHFVEQALLHHHLASVHRLQIETSSLTGQFIASVYDIFVRNDLTLAKLHVHPGQEYETIELLCRVPNTAKLTQAVSELRSLPGVRSINADLLDTNAELVKPKDQH